MKLAPAPFTIGPDDGFENTDLFEYKDFGERFANIVEALDSATVIVLDGPWGSGKTTFTQQWAGLLRQRKHAVVQFDAFANDYQDDAFIALAGAIHAYSGDGKSEGAEKLKETFLKSAAGVGKALPSIATRVAVNLVTQGALSAAAVSKLVASIESANTSLLEKRIAGVRENTQAVEEFRERLSELAMELTRYSTTSEEEAQPRNKATRKCVVIIDELDRCKPTFALSLLERIKHLFSVEEIVFVLVAHLAQLAKMVEKEYGVDSGARYLEKFYHRQVRLPVHEQQPAKQRQDYLEHLWKSMRVQNDDPRILQLVTEGLGKLAEIYDLPLRMLEHVAGSVVLVCVATNRNHFSIRALDLRPLRNANRRSRHVREGENGPTQHA